VWEFHELIPRLTDPGRFGGDPADAFTIVAPSLPGFTLSFQPGGGGDAPAQPRHAQLVDAISQHHQQRGGR
jgi:hypothetical protein